MMQYFTNASKTKKILSSRVGGDTNCRVTSARVSGIITQDMPNQISEMYLKVVF